MKTSKTNRMLTSVIVVGFTFLMTACSSSAPSSVAPSNLAPVNGGSTSTPAAKSYNNLDPSDPSAVAFVQALNSQYPELSGSKTDVRKLKIGTAVCSEISTQARLQKHKITPEELNSFVVNRTEPYLGTRPATETEAAGIASLAVQNICPEYTDYLTK